MKINNKIIRLKRFINSIVIASEAWQSQRMAPLKARKSVSLLLVIILSLFLVAVPMAGTVEAMPNEVWVDDDFTSGTTSWDITHFAIIQDGISVVAEGGTVNVAAGTYPEDVTIGTIGMTLQAGTKHEAVIEGTVVIDAANVTVDGFSIKNFSQIPTSDWSGIYMPSGTGILVANNLIDGIAIDPVANLTVGIHTLHGSTAEATLEGNIIKNVRMGIYSQGGSLLISNNSIEENINHCGIGIDTSAGTLITGNTISNCADQGIEVFGENVVANFNNITGNPNFGIQSFDSILFFYPQVDAKANWWGDASGPSHPSNPGGTGDKVSDNVDFMPFLFPDVTITKTGPATANQGNNITYAIIYKNEGTFNATSVVITETYHSGVKFVSASKDPDDGTNNQWTIGTLAPEQGGTINVTVQIK